MKAIKIAKSPYTGLTCNVAYAVGNCVIGFAAHSWWFITVGAYYAVLATARFLSLMMAKGAQKSTP